jgi:tetratricopeptide (TPR) repeat protein
MRLWSASALLSLTLLLMAAPAAADSRREQDARAAYKAGAAAYEAGDYQLAYDKFKESFQLSHAPALLYNIASAQQGLKRPHDAAESLRSFLRVQPNDPDRPIIEQRIATLEEEQRMIDADRAQEEAARRPPPVVTVPAPAPPALRLTAAPPADRPGDADRRHKRTVVAVTVSIAAAVVVAGAITLAVLLSDGGSEPYSMSSLGPHPGTH